MPVFSLPTIGDVAAGDSPPPLAAPEPEAPPPSGDAPAIDPSGGLTGANEVAQAAFEAALAAAMVASATNALAGSGGGGGGAAAAVAAGTGVSGVGLVSLIGPVFNVTDTGLVDTDFTITHNLGFTSLFYIVVKASVACDIYTGSVAADATTITLRCNVANANVWILIPGAAG